MQNTQDAATARDQLIRENLPLVGYAVNAMASRIPRYVPRDDLQSAGFLGLTQAAIAYDPSTGVPFDRFAKVRIQGALLDELRSRDWASRSVRRNARKMRAAKEAIMVREGRDAELPEIAVEMGVAQDDVQKLVDDVHRGTVLNYESLMVDGPADEILPATQSTPEARILARERRGVLLDAIAALPERLRLVITGYFFEEQPMAQIADELGVTESRVSQMRSEAFNLIRTAMEITLDEVVLPVEDRPRGRGAKTRSTYFAAVANSSSLSERLAAAPEHMMAVAA